MTHSQILETQGFNLDLCFDHDGNLFVSQCIIEGDNSVEHDTGLITKFQLSNENKYVESSFPHLEKLVNDVRIMSKKPISKLKCRFFVFLLSFFISIFILLYIYFFLSVS